MSSSNDPLQSQSNIFKKSLLNFIRPSPSPVYGVHHPYGLTLLTRFRLGMSHLREHKFPHNFNDTVDPFCFCRSNSIERMKHYLLHCPMHAAQRILLSYSLRDNGVYIFPLRNTYLTRLLLYGDHSKSKLLNKIILECTI